MVPYRFNNQGLFNSNKIVVKINVPATWRFATQISFRGGMGRGGTTPLKLPVNFSFYFKLPKIFTERKIVYNNHVPVPSKFAKANFFTGRAGMGK